MESNRLQRAEQTTGKRLKPMLRFLQREREQVEQEIECSIKSSPIWQTKRELLASMKGIGEASYSPLLAWLPELGYFSRQKICALVGVAPYEDDTGQWHGRRHISGVRDAVRRVLYMATMRRFASTLCCEITTSACSTVGSHRRRH